MDVINNRVWIENTSPRVTDISMLDLDTYCTISVLKKAGAKFELGLANPPVYGVGIYCTNFSLDEIKKILMKNRQFLSRPIEEVPRSYKIEEDRVSNLQKQLKSLAVRYNLAMHKGAFGIKGQDIETEVIETFNKDIIPIIDSLTIEEQARLLEMLKDNREENSEIIVGAITRINHNLGLDDEEIEEERITESDMPTLITSKIVTLLKNYHLAKKEGIYGANNEIVLNSLANEFNNVIIPSIMSLSSEEKIILAEKLNNLSSLDMGSDIIGRLVDQIYTLIGRSK